MKKVCSLLLALSLAAALLAGCGGTPSTSSPSQAGGSGQETEKTHISFMGWGTDSEIAAYEAMIAQFEEAYPDVEVEYIQIKKLDAPAAPAEE